MAVRNAATLLGGILQRALESGHLQANPARAVRKSPYPRRKEVRPVAPIVVERMRAVAGTRDATLIVLAYAGLDQARRSPLQWRDVREQTLLIERALSLGHEDDTKTDAHRTVRLLFHLPLTFRVAPSPSGRPGAQRLIFHPAPESPGRWPRTSGRTGVRSGARFRWRTPTHAAGRWNKAARRVPPLLPSRARRPLGA